ncbi:hypothetical protein, partial [Solemya velum gill symbiont]|uniref:hypothetical protein n=1 Tax=Solemya velum gill symbiont TaxID=2340 RepID=UPI00117B10C4
MNQSVAALRFNINQSTKFSPFFLVYNRDVVLPLDNLLRPRRKYTGEESYKIQLEQQHKSFIQVHKRLKIAKKRQARYADKNSKLIDLDVGDPVYLKNHQKHSKLDVKWQPYYRIIQKKTPRTFVIRNQLTGKTVNSNIQHLRLADIDEWKIPKAGAGYRPRGAVYV